jgi:hypothetical protein
VPEIAADIMATAAIAGHRRTPVRALARLSGVNVRVLESRLKTAGLIPAEHLLGWMVSLHTLWRRDVLAWTPKRTATSANFETSDVWTSYVARQVGARPATLLRSGGFANLLDRCATRMSFDRSEHRA